MSEWTHRFCERRWFDGPVEWPSDFHKKMPTAEDTEDGMTGDATTDVTNLLQERLALADETLGQVTAEEVEASLNAIYEKSGIARYPAAETSGSEGKKATTSG